MGDGDGSRAPGWFDDVMTRRAVLGLFGLSAIAAGCSSDRSITTPASSTVSPSGAPGSSSTASSASAATQTAPATASPTDSTPPTESTSPPTTTGTAATTEHTSTPTAESKASVPPGATDGPATGAPTAAPPSTAAPASAAVTAGPTPTIVLGSNANVTTDILRSDSEAYGGAWKGNWTWADGSGSGVMSATGTVDIGTRLITGTGNVTGAMLSTPIPAIDVTVAVDSWKYDNDGNFSIGFPTVVGAVTLSSNGGFGKFKLHVDVAGRDDVVAFDATGVANRPSAIPVLFTMTSKDGSTKSGSVTFRPG